MFLHLPVKVAVELAQPGSRFKAEVDREPIEITGDRKLVHLLQVGRNEVKEMSVGLGLAGPINIYWVAGLRARSLPHHCPGPGPSS